MSGKTKSVMIASLLLTVLLIATCNEAVVVSAGEIPVPSPGRETVQKAISAAGAGDTIRVGKGTYRENIVVNKSVAIIGENAATTVIDGDAQGNVITIIAPNVMISGFTIRNGTSEVYPYCGISIFYCNFATITNNLFVDNYYGLQVTGSNSSKIFNNTFIGNSYAGIKISESNSNVFYENTVERNFIGLWSSSTQSNVFYHNNFINNTNQLLIFASTTVWDDGRDGNYWSDYYGQDTDLDGIGDSQYTVAGDRYPLMGRYTNFTFPYKSKTYYLVTICNSTISNFHFDEQSRKAEFNVSGPNATVGFCRITSPAKCTLSINGQPPPIFRNWTIPTQFVYYLPYSHTESMREIDVTLELADDGSSPPLLTYAVVASLVLLTVAVTVIVFRIRRSKKRPK